MNKTDLGVKNGPIPAAPGRLLKGGIPLPDQAADRRSLSQQNLKGLIASLKLPQDGLSSNLINYARFFSLPLEPALLSRLRRDALTVKALRNGPGQRAGKAGSPEAAALAAAAAAAKGVELAPEALERYAAALDPDWGQKDGTEQETPDQGSGGEAPDEDLRQGETEETQAILREITGQLPGLGTPTGIRGIAEPPVRGSLFNGETEDPLLNFLNRLPDRNGNFWLVFPFKILLKKVEFRAAVRLLLRIDSVGKRQDRIAIDALGEKRRWLFIMNNPGRPGALSRVFLSPPPGETARKKLEEEIRGTLKTLGGNVTVNSGEAASFQGSFKPSFFADTGVEAAASIDEEV